MAGWQGLSRHPAISKSILRQSRSQSPQAFLSAVGCLERLWDNGTEVRQNFWRKTRGRYTKQSIKKKIFYSSSPVSPGDQPLTKKPEDSEIDIGSQASLNHYSL